MRYLNTTIIKNISDTKEIPNGLGEAIYVWVALNPKSNSSVRLRTNYIGQTTQVKQRQQKRDHQSKLTGDMDLLIFNLEESILNQRQVLECLVYEYLTRGYDEDYRNECINQVIPILPRVITRHLLDEVFEVIQNITEQLDTYLDLGYGISDIRYLQKNKFIEINQRKGKLQIIEPTIKESKIEIYNPQTVNQPYQPNHLAQGSIIVNQTGYYTYTNKKGRPYYKNEEIIKYISSKHIQEQYLEPLTEIVGLANTKQALSFRGRHEV